MASRSPTMVITQRLWSESISRSSRETPGIFMASTMASTMALSRPSEKLGTHSTSVDITGKNKGFTAKGAKDAARDLAIELIGNLVNKNRQPLSPSIAKLLITHLPNYLNQFIPS